MMPGEEPASRTTDLTAVVPAGDSRMPRARFWLFYTAAWIPYIYIYASVVLITGEATLWPAVGLALVSALPAALLGLGVVWATGRIATPPTRPPAFFAIHAIMGIVYAQLAVLGTGTLIHFLWPMMNGSTVIEEQDMKAAIWWQLFMALMVYVTITSIAYAFRSTVRLREEGNRLARAEALKARAELQALRAQINPHFLFNTLHSTLALVRTDSAAAEDAIEQFGDLLRYTTRTQAESLDRVPLREEWAFVRNYLSLERLRLGERLRVSASLHESIEEHLVPAFCLQPLVENAVRHGISPRASGGHVWLQADRTPEGILLEVRDDGPGCDPQRVTGNGRLGLRLVRQRLDVLYAGKAVFDVKTAPGQGFHVRLVIPADEPRSAQVVEQT